MNTVEVVNKLTTKMSKSYSYSKSASTYFLEAFAENYYLSELYISNVGKVPMYPWFHL